jgi:regulatory protein
LDNKALKTKTKRSAFDAALGYIARSQKTKRQIEGYLSLKKYTPEDIKAAVDKLEAYNYINDAVFAAAYVDYYAAVRGKLRLKYDLASKGVDKDVLNAALAKIENQREAAHKAALKYAKNKPLDKNLSAKVGAHLYGKGFEKRDISYALGKIFDAELMDGEVDGELLEEDLAGGEFGIDAD